MYKSESIAALAAALTKAQGEIENANKNASNPHFKSKYADLAEVLNVIRPTFTKHGLSFIQMPSYDDGIATVTTVLLHESGEFIESAASAPLSKQDAQGVGACTTYLRRYSLAAFSGIAQEDDDGHTASTVVYASPEELEDIRTALKLTEMTEEALCKKGRIKKLEELEKSRVPGVMKMLKDEASK